MKRIIHLNLGVILSSEFDLEKAVCNHGQFMMPPNQWIPFSKTLQRPLRLYNSNYSVLVSIKQTSSFLLTIQIHSSSSSSSSSSNSTHHQDEQAILVLYFIYISTNFILFLIYIYLLIINYYMMCRIKWFGCLGLRRKMKTS